MISIVQLLPADVGFYIWLKKSNQDPYQDLVSLEPGFLPIWEILFLLTPQLEAMVAMGA